MLQEGLLPLRQMADIRVSIHVYHVSFGRQSGAIKLDSNFNPAKERLFDFKQNKNKSSLGGARDLK